MKLEVWFENGDVKYIDLTEMEKKRGKARTVQLVDSACIELDETEADCIQGDM